MCGGDEDCSMGMSSLTNEEPLVVMEVNVDVVREVIRKDRGDSRGSVVRKGEASLCCSGRGSVRERSLGAEDGDMSNGWKGGVHRGSKVFTSMGSNENIVGVNGNVLMKRGEEEGVEDFLGDLGGSGRRSQQRWGN